jgi:hypothetical protein
MILETTFVMPGAKMSTIQKNLTFETLKQQVRELAYKKWEESGRPWGRDKEFWVTAEKELFGDEPLRSGGYRLKIKGSQLLICPINSEIPVERD